VFQPLSFTTQASAKPVQKKSLAAPSIFSGEQEEDPLTSRRKRPLQLLGDPLGTNGAPDAKKRKLDDPKSIIDSIPTDKDELFNYTIDWAVVDKVRISEFVGIFFLLFVWLIRLLSVTQHELVQTKLKPWISRKIVEYLGAEESVLIEYICTQIAEHKPPSAIREELAIVLEDEADVFVVKLWRMLIFEMIRAS